MAVNITLTQTQHAALRECVELQLHRHQDLRRLMVSEGRGEPENNRRARIALASIAENLDNNGHGNEMPAL